MREIKFRGYDGRIASERMLDGIELDRNIVRTYGTNKPHELAISTSNQTKVILMQYTGLKDKNGVEIYEGDIVDAPFSEWSAPVVFRTARYELDGPGYANQQNFQEHPEVYEVIGNIYENPELLKETR